MQTRLTDYFRKQLEGQEAEAILRSCVHCGFCNATCPTYQELHDERDGPRGRIYLIKQFLEGAEVTEKTRLHLDRCLTCRSCETTCPSGVQYGRLADIGRHQLEKQLPRSPTQQWIRWGLRQILPYPKRFAVLLCLGQFVRPVTPGFLKKKIPPKQKRLNWPQNKHNRTMLVLTGCAQVSATPNTNAAAAQVLDKLKIRLLAIAQAGCCGAVSQHLSAPDEALDFMRRNIDAWWPEVEKGTEAIVASASGCGAMLKEYGHLLKDDLDYAHKAQRISELSKDLVEILSQENLKPIKKSLKKQAKSRLAFHCPCTLQHALKLNGKVESLLKSLGFQLTQTKENHLCCGSAGTYSILQPKMSQKLLARKLKALNLEQPERIVTANIGCQLHLGTKAEVPVQHWIELLIPEPPTKN